VTISNYGENKLLDAMLNHTTTGGGLPTADVWVKLHTADPGEDGLTAAATEATRKQLSVGAAAAGVCTSDADLIWTSVAGSETYSHVSLWDASTAGNCLWTGALTLAKAVIAGDTFTIPTGSLTVSLD